MLKMFKKNEKKNKGFTLVELIIVIAILAILVGILAPQYIKYVEKSRKAADASNIDNVVNAIKVASADEDYSLPEGKYTVTLSKSNLEVKGEGTAAVGALTAPNGNGALTKALIEYMGNDANSATYTSGKATFYGTKLKSEKWKGDSSGNAESIIATVEVSDTGAVSVSYSPKSFATYAGSSRTTPSDPSTGE